MKIIDLPVSSATVRAYEFGSPDARPLVILHGNHQSAEPFFFLEGTDVSGTYRVCLIELPGHGHSRGFDLDEYRIDRIAENLIKMIKALYPDQSPILVGHSLGGHIACQMIAQGFIPCSLGLISSLPLDSVQAFGKAFLPSEALGALFTPDLSSEQQLLVAKAFSLGIPQLEQTFLAQLRAVDPQFRSGMAKLFSEPCFQNELAALEQARVPVSLALGDRDQFLNTQYLKQVLEPSAITKGGSFPMRIPGCYHFPQVSHPEDFARFLSELNESVP